MADFGWSDGRGTAGLADMQTADTLFHKLIHTRMGVCILRKGCLPVSRQPLTVRIFYKSKITQNYPKNLYIRQPLKTMVVFQL